MEPGTKSNRPVRSVRLAHLRKVGQHFYWQIGGFQFHGEFLITFWVAVAILFGSASIAIRDSQTIPKDS